MRRHGPLLGLGLVLLSVLAACGSGATATPTATATPAEDESAYLEQVRAHETRVGDTVREITEALSITWPVPSRLYQVLGEAGLTEVLESAAQDAERLTPPERFKEDHQRYIQLLRFAQGDTARFDTS